MDRSALRWYRVEVDLNLEQSNARSLMTDTSDLAILKLKQLLAADSALNSEIREAILSDLDSSQPSELAALKAFLFSDTENEAIETEGKQS